jgi:hypothetical protein
VDRVPSTLVVTPVLRLHQAIYRGTRGWLGKRLIGRPSLLLTTIGRRTGRQRLSPERMADTTRTSGVRHARSRSSSSTRRTRQRFRIRECRADLQICRSVCAVALRAWGRAGSMS